MSGGHFNYAQYKINEIVDSIEKLIEDNEDGFSDKTIQEFETGRELLLKAQIYAQRIDWLVSGDDLEKTFHKRLKEDLEKIELED